MQLVDLGRRKDKSLLPGGGNLVDPSLPSLDNPHAGFEKSPSFHSVQQRVERTGPDAISMMPELLHHRQTEDLLVRGMDEHMDPDEAGKELSLMFQHKVNITLFEKLRH